LREIGKGQDPGQRKIEKRRAETFSELAREYIERHASKKRSGREDVRLLNGSARRRSSRGGLVGVRSGYGLVDDSGRAQQEWIRASRAALGRKPSHSHGVARNGRRFPVGLSDRKTGPHIAHAQKAIERIVRPPGSPFGVMTCGAPRPA
jgi:hypothetical protein